MARSKKIAMSSEDAKYQAKWDLDTLQQAEKIKKDSARMKAAENFAKEQIKMLGGIVSKPTVSRSSFKKK
jgi:hypothetical protein